MAKKTFAATLAVVLAVLVPSLSAQRNSQASPSAREAPAAPAPAPVPVLKVDSRIVVVDVVVTDSKQNPVHGLKAEDFQVSEQGTAQTIRHFEEHAPGKASAFPPMPKMAPNVFTNYTPTPPGGALNVILLDALNTPTRDQLRVREQLLEYVKTIPPGARVAIFGLNATLSLLQGFTSDTEVLRRALERMPNTSAVLADPQGGNGTKNSLADDIEDNPPDSGQDSHLAELIVANIRQFEVDEKAADINIRARTTLDAMDQIGHYLAGLQGRKNLLWFSGSFPLSMRPQDGDKSPFGVVTNYETEFRQTVNLLTRAQVALYPIDGRGLFNLPTTDAASSRNYSGAKGAIRVAQDREAFFLDTSDEHETMLDLAQATGGRAFFNTNGLSDATTAAITSGENYYTLTYSPSDPHPKTDFRNIKIQTGKKGLALAYRRGYYPDSPDKIVAKENDKDHSPRSVATHAAEHDSARTLQAAMMRGGPAPTEILFKVDVSTAGTSAPPEAEPAPGNVLAPKAHGPFHRYEVAYAINPGNITFQRTAEGKAHAGIKLIVFVYNADGKLLNSAGNIVNLNLGPEQVAALFASQGIDAHQSISVPANGQYYLRIAVQDLNHDRAGAVEIATSQVKPMPPATPAAPPR